jgi:hypothetical protein
MNKNIDLCFVGSKPESTFIGLTNEERKELANDLISIYDGILKKYSSVKFPYNVRCRVNTRINNKFYIQDINVEMHSKTDYIFTFIQLDEVSQDEYLDNINERKKTIPDFKKVTD